MVVTAHPSLIQPLIVLISHRHQGLIGTLMLRSVSPLLTPSLPRSPVSSATRTGGVNKAVSETLVLKGARGANGRELIEENEFARLHSTENGNICSGVAAGR